jgi:class 3 adenylate cyclase
LETRTVVALFTDVVGSTELSRSLSPADADEVRRRVFATMRRAVAETGGTEVKNLGDGLMVVFDSASEALACAVAMQQGADLDNRREPHRVEIRVGLSGGEVTVEEDDYFGDPVVEAARLCATCTGGEIRAALVVQLTAGRRSRHRCRPLGPLALKGIPDPVETVAIDWEPLARVVAGPVPLPERLAVRPTEGVVGRSEELTAVAAARQRVEERHGRELVLVSGEPGLGKTTLLGEASRAAFADGCTVTFGHAEEDVVAPYQLFAEAIAHIVTHADEELLRAHVAEYGSSLLTIAPVLATRIRDLPDPVTRDVETERFVLFSAVVGLLARCSEARPLVIVLDDLQWADTGSLNLLRHVAASPQLPAVLVLASLRDDTSGRYSALLDTLAVLHRMDGVRRIELAGLEDDEVLALFETLAGHSLDRAGSDLAHTVARETDGNPYFVRELIRHLVETGAVAQDASGRWAAGGAGDAGPLELPDSIRDVIRARVGRLGDDTGRVLGTASVIGRDFDLALLGAATRRADDELLDVLDTAIDATLVRERAVGQYSFAHALVQHTLYQGLGATRRARAHRQVALALTDLDAHRPGTRAAELARHWSSTGDPLDAPRAVACSCTAGLAALTALAPAEALRHFENARELGATVQGLDDVLVLDLAIGLGTAQRQTGDPAFRTTLLDAARRARALGDTKRLVAAALANNRGWMSTVGEIDADRVEVLEGLLPFLADDDTDRALALGMLCAELSYGSPLGRREALASEAIAIARASGDDTTIVQVSNSVSFALAVPSLLDESAPRTADALERATRLGDPVLRFHAAVSRANDAGRAADLDEVDRCHAVEQLVAEQLDQPSLRWTHAFNRAWRAQFAGDVDEAERLGTLALQIGTDGGEPDAAVFFGVQVMMVALQRGTLADLLPLIEASVAENPGLPGFRAKLAMAYAECDLGARAGELLDDFAAAGYQLPDDVSWLSGMCDYAEAAVQCADPRHASALLERLEPWSEQVSTIGGVTADGPVCHFVGGLSAVLDRFEGADRHFTRSAAMCRRMGARYFAARTNLSWAELLLRRDATGDRAQGRRLLDEAIDAATVYGYGTVERRSRVVREALL